MHSDKLVLSEDESHVRLVRKTVSDRRSRWAIITVAAAFVLMTITIPVVILVKTLNDSDGILPNGYIGFVAGLLWGIMCGLLVVQGIAALSALRWHCRTSELMLRYHDELAAFKLTNGVEDTGEQ